MKIGYSAALTAFTILISLMSCSNLITELPGEMMETRDETAITELLHTASENIELPVTATGDLDFPASGDNGESITWTSDNPSIINPDGTVNRPSNGSGDVIVTITAQVEIDGVIVSKDFEITVPELPPLSITLADGDKSDNITGSLIFPTEDENGNPINWISNNPSIIDENGVVNRPSFGQGDSVVTITAEYRENGSTAEEDFIFIVKEQEPTDSEIVAESADTLDFPFAGDDTFNSVTEDIVFPNTGENGISITWSSDKEGLISSDGKVVPPSALDGEATVTISAEISKGMDSETVDFTVTVTPASNETFTPQTGIEFNMVYVPAKSYIAGINDDGDKNNGSDITNLIAEPEGTSVSESFYISDSEVTNRQWQTVYNWAISNGYTFATDNDGSADDYAVSYLSWYDAIIWSNALTEYTNAGTGSEFTCVYRWNGAPLRNAVEAASLDTISADPQADGFRLLTSDEWELAARFKGDKNSDGDITDGFDSATREYYRGSEMSGEGIHSASDVAWTDENNSQTWFTAESGSGLWINHFEVKTTPRNNALGLYDMSGNVWEWVFDKSINKNSEEVRLWRGGSAYNHYVDNRVAFIGGSDPTYTECDMGLRIGRNY